MKYTTEIIIKLPLEAFIKKLNNPANMKHWQNGFTHYELISGTPGEIGLKMKLHYKFGKRKMELTETITKYNLPNEIHATYDSNGMHNVQENYFSSTADNHTKWISVNEFLATKFFLRLMTLIMPSAFKKQTRKYLEDFKKFAENDISINSKK